MQTRGYDPKTPPGHIDLSPAEERSYSPLRAIGLIAEGKWGSKGCLEKEVSDTIAARTGKGARSFYLPMNIRASVTGNVVGTASLGGNAVETSVMGFIDILRNRMVTRQLGATVLTGLTGNVAIPRQTAANTFAWVGENPSSAATLTAMTLDQITLSPKVGMGATAYSRLAAIQTSPDLNNLTVVDLATTCAIALDHAALNGSGSGTEPRGIRNQSGINTVAIGTHGGNLTWAKVLGFESEVATDNADAGNMAFATTPGVRGSAKQILRSTTAGSMMLWEGDELGGYKAMVSNQLPSNLTKGTSATVCHAAIFGDWSQLIIGEWGGAVDILVDPYTYAGQGMIAVYSYVNADVAVRQPTAFAVCSDILT